MIREESSRHRSGVVALVGRPNVGKSTLLNALIGQKLAAVSRRPQTTRVRQIGILTLPEAQAVLVDTPGFHVPRDALGEVMAQTAEQALQDADLILWVLDASRPLAAEDRLVAQRVGALGAGEKTLPVANKGDLISPADLPSLAEEIRLLLPGVPLRRVSAASGQGIPELLQAVVARLPLGPALYPPEQVTASTEREIVGELVREAALRQVREEVPHGLAVIVNQFLERERGKTFVDATLIVEKESHKPILIGKGGERLKRIGTEARAQIESALGRDLFLSLRVKVYPNWREREALLRRLGFRTARRGPRAHSSPR
ncbi:MAG: GTPase Era [Anaerolineales bacterium]|jgi:GTP-binding protein Era